MDTTSHNVTEDLDLDLLASAKLNIPNLLPEVQRISFTEDYRSHDTVLLELTEDLLEQLENGSSFTVRGSTEDFAVFCTENRTFEMKLREISNNMLLSADLETADSLDREAHRKVSRKGVAYMHNTFFELRHLVPRCARAKHLLEEAPFSGEEFELEIENCRKYTLDELLETVQSSRVELQHYLSDVIYSCQIDGKVRLLTHGYVTRLLCRLLDWLQSNSLSWEDIPDYEASSALLELEPESVMRDFFWRRFSIKTDKTLKLVPEAVARAIAADFLKTGNKVRYDEFLRWWRNTVPLGVAFEDRLLHGMAYKTENETPMSLCYLPTEDLPFDPEKRFRHLFKERTMWPREELLPYVLDILTESDTVDRLLLKFARSYTAEGKSFFISLSQI